MDIRPLGNVSAHSISTEGGARDSAAVNGTDGDVAAPASGSGAERGAPADRIEISAAAREAARVRDIVTNTPDVREDKIAPIQQKLADGTYQVSPDQIANKLLGGA